jgi:ADP-ribose diphosphatase
MNNLPQQADIEQRPASPEILDVKLITTTQIFHVERVTLKFSNGEVRDFERLKVWEPGVVMIVAMPNPETILLVREYAAGINDYSLSFPKGRVEKEEDIYVSANRELQEEVGFKANKLTLLKSMTTAPGYSSTLTHLVLAEDLVPSHLAADEPEPLLVVPFPLKEMHKLVARNDFHEARALTALYLVREHLKKHE